jgi:hyperosmotically inducible protein
LHLSIVEEEVGKMIQVREIAMKSIITKVSVLVAALLLAGSVAFADPGSPGDSNSKTLVQQVRHELVTLPYYGVFDNLAYKVEGGTVTLYGQVVNPTTRSDAAHRVAKLPGVQKVVNDIEVLPLSSFDNGIRIRTYRTIARWGGLNRYLTGANPSIHIIVDNGRVTLEGVVDNKADSDAANVVANSVPGVFSVTNHLQVAKPVR